MSLKIVSSEDHIVEGYAALWDEPNDAGQQYDRDAFKNVAALARKENHESANDDGKRSVRVG
jgi:hypothetical protein